MTTISKKKGTAMGKNFSPIYATLVLSLRRILCKSREKNDCRFKQFIVDNFRRFLNDRFILLINSDEDLEKLHVYLNELHLSIKFTIERNMSNFRF